MKLELLLHRKEITLNNRRYRYQEEIKDGEILHIKDYHSRIHFEYKVIDIIEIENIQYGVRALIEAELIKDYKVPSIYYEVYFFKDEKYSEFAGYTDDLELAKKVCDELGWAEVCEIRENNYKKIVYKKEKK
jgi:hypothetical protein